MKRVVFVLFLGAAVLLTGLSSVAARPAADSPVEGAALSTPQLIDRDFVNGDITAEERILFLAYAIYDFESLPAKYDSPVGWYGTRQVAAVKDAYFGGAFQFSAPVAAELERVLTVPADDSEGVGQFCDRPNEATIDTTSSTRFAFSYGTITGPLTFSSYVTSMDTSANAILTSYGWAEPPICGANDAGGNCTQVGTNDLGNKYPVLIVDLGTSLFGYVDANTSSGEAYNGFVGNNPNTAIAETDSLATCMVLNSDMAQLGGVAQSNLDGTTSHEYVHAVQNAWGDPGAQMDAMWAESTAAYFEDEVFDSANSQYLYLYGDFNNGSLGPCVGTNCATNGWPSMGSGPNEYANFLMFRYITERFGGANSSTGGEKVIQRFFENVALGGSNGFQDKELSAFANAVEAFSPSGPEGLTQFKDIFHEWAIAGKFVKDCQDNPGYGTTYCMEEGTEYKASTNFGNESVTTGNSNVPAVAGTVASIPATYNGTIKSDYGLNWVRMPLGTTPYDITLTRTSGTGSLRGSVVCDTGTMFNIQAFAANVGATPQTISNYNPTGCNDVILVITNEELTNTLSPVAASGFSAAATAAATAVELSDAGVAGPAQTGNWLALALLASALATAVVYARRRSPESGL